MRYSVGELRPGVDSYWQGAKCQGTVTKKKIQAKKEKAEVFFPGKGRPRTTPQYKEFCSTCPIRTFCLAYGLVHDEVGVWGGFTEQERQLLPPEVKAHYREMAKQHGWLEVRRELDEIAEVIALVREAGYEIDSMEIFGFEAVL